MPEREKGKKEERQEKKKEKSGREKKRESSLDTSKSWLLFLLSWDNLHGKVAVDKYFLFFFEGHGVFPSGLTSAYLLPFIRWKQKPNIFLFFGPEKKVGFLVQPSKKKAHARFFM